MQAPRERRRADRCRQHIDAGVNLPWTLYDLGKPQLLLGQRSEGLIASARAVELSTASFMIQTSLESLNRLAERREAWAGVDEARAILALGLAVNFPLTEAQVQLEEILQPRQKLSGPVLFVVGHAEADAREKVSEALRGYRGTVVEKDWLQGWADVVGSGLPASGVVVVAVDGSKVELRVGATLGARVLEVGSMKAEAIRAALYTPE